VSASTQRLQPGLWAKFAAASLIMKVRSTQLPLKVFNEVFKNTYTLERKSGRLFGFDSSRTLPGRAQTKNWIGTALGDIKVSLTELDLNSDQIRRLLKKTFYS